MHNETSPSLPESRSERAADARASARTNLFLAAVLHATHFSVPARVRNLSAAGALLEAPVAPDCGTAIRLVRGSLAVAGNVVWSADGRCGVRFSSRVSVREWLAPAMNREQRRIDDAIRLLKAGAIPLAVGGRSGEAGAASLGSDLKSVARLLELLAADLAGNEATLRAHRQELQNVDIAVQMLDAVASALHGDQDEAATVSRIENLRVSCGEALARAG